jgi:hypothetical protein
VVTGAASGIGRACAVRLTQDGANVAALDIDQDGLEETARLVEDVGRRFLPVHAVLILLASGRECRHSARRAPGWVPMGCPRAPLLWLRTARRGILRRFRRRFRLVRLASNLEPRTTSPRSPSAGVRARHPGARGGKGVPVSCPELPLPAVPGRPQRPNPPSSRRSAVPS